MLRNLQLNIDATCAHEGHWPYIDVVINDKIAYSDYLNNKNLLNITFQSLEKNTIVLHYKNKRNGPDIWDTIIDNQGNINKDQCILIKGIRIDKCNLNFLIHVLKFELLNDELIDCFGYLAYNGRYKIEYCEPYYEWVHSTRLKYTKQIDTDEFDSSLPYSTNYVYNHDNKKLTEVLKQFQNTVDAAKNLSIIDPVSRSS